VTKMQEEINEKSKGKIVVRDLQIVSRWVWRRFVAKTSLYFFCRGYRG
jgi:hypothetical protein